MELFRTLSKEEEKEFRDYARKTYKAYDPIPGIWHPIIQAECTKMNEEAGKKFDPESIIPKKRVDSRSYQINNEYTNPNAEE